MERLTFVKCPKYWDTGRHPTPYSSRKTFQEVVARLAYYEDMEEQGRLVVLPEGLSTAQKCYESLQDSLDKHNRETMRKIAEFIEPTKEGTDHADRNG